MTNGLQFKRLIYTTLERGKNISVESKIPDMLKNDLDVKSIHSTMKLVGTPAKYRSFSPLIKATHVESKKILIDAKPTIGEKHYLRQVVNRLYEYTGGIFMNYKDVSPEDYWKVDAGHNVKKIGPKVTKDEQFRRYDNLMSYITAKEDAMGKPDYDVLYDAYHLVLSLFQSHTPKTVNTDFSVNTMTKIRIEKTKSSNTGFPYGRNERKEYKPGITYRQRCAQLTHDLVKTHGLSGVSAIPAMIIGRDQNKGNNLDMAKDIEALNHDILNGNYSYLPSKARVVFAIAQIVNNLALPPLAALLDIGKNNGFPPIFCALTSRDSRAPIMRKFMDLINRHKLVSLNLDYENFDLHNSAIGRVIAYLFRMDLTDGQGKIYDYTVPQVLEHTAVNGLYTNFIVCNPYKNNQLEFHRKDRALASGEAYTNFDGGVVNAIAITYCYLKMYGYNYVKELYSKFLKDDTSPLFVVGDDVLCFLKSYEDLDKLSNIMKNELGFVIGSDEKTAYGFFFIQERGTPSNPLPVYPITRIAESMLYTETSKGFGGAVGDMAFLNTIYNGIHNIKDLYHSFIRLFASLDRYRLGTIDESGKKITPQTLSKVAASQQAEFGDTVQTALYNGDPAKQYIFKDSNIKDDVVTNYFYNVRSALNDTTDLNKLVSLGDTIKSKTETGKDLIFNERNKPHND